MQTRFKYFFLLPIVAVLLFTSCSKTNKEGRNIPNGAAFVVHMNGKSLSSKLPWEEIKQSEIFKTAYSDSATSSFIKSVLDNPENTGIDVKNDLLFFALKDSAGGYMAIEGTIKDEAKFKQFNKEASKSMAVESDEDGIHFSNTPNMTSSWNKDKFVLVMDAPMFSMEGMNKMRRKYDDSTATYTPPVKRDMVPIAKQLFNLKEDNSLGKEEKFTDLMKSDGDIHFWMNTEALAAGGLSAEAMGPLSMMNMNKLYEGSRVTGTITFENGKINADFRSYSGKEMTELMKKYSGDKVNAEMIKRIPSKNLAGLFALNFKPEGIREYLKLLGMDGFANMASPMLGFNLDDFIKANKGDILLAVSDISQDSFGKPNASVLFSASIGDKPSFDKLVKAGDKLSKEKLGEGSTSFAYNMNEKYFAIGNKKEDIDKYITTAGNTSFDFMDKISGSAGAAYINFQYILKNMGSAMRKDSLEMAVYDASVKMWDNLVAYSAGNSTQHIEINLVDKTTNSLRQLNNYLGTLGMLKKKQDQRYKNTAGVMDTDMPATDTTPVSIK